jgi:D-amino peptidase
MNRVHAVALAVLLAAPASAQEGKLKVYISMDMEGIGGVVSRDQTDPSGFEYEQARKWMTGEANAAIQAAFESGASEVLVSDSHGNAESVLPDELDERVRLIRGWPRKLLMMEGIDESFGAAMFIGYHASEGMRHATLAHTMSGGKIQDLKLNGKRVPEAGFNAAIAGHFGVPVVLISGDQTVIAETRALVGDIEGAEVKTGMGAVASMLHPKRAQALVKDRAKKALARRADFEPWKLEAPITLEIAFKSEADAENAGYLPGARIVDGRTVQFTGKDMVEVSGFFAGVFR